MDMKLSGKTVLITGGSRGIGFACAMAFASEGCAVHIASRSKESLDSARENIRARHNVPVFGCLWAWGPTWTQAMIDTLRAQPGAEAAPLTVLAPQLLVARTRGATTQQVRATLEATWRALRPQVLGRAAVAPRIWST